MFYVGRGVGAGDDGQYQVNCPGVAATLAWRYRVIRLWQMKAEELLALGRPALLALVGQTQVDKPDEVLPKVVESMHTVPDAELRGRLFTTLIALISDKEMIQMVEKLIEKDELLLDTPYLSRIREEGREEGRAEGRVEGSLIARRRSILDALALRFDPPISVYQKVEQHLLNITDEGRLETLFAATIRSESMADFQAAMASDNPTIRR